MVNVKLSNTHNIEVQICCFAEDDMFHQDFVKSHISVQIRFCQKKGQNIKVLVMCCCPWHVSQVCYVFLSCVPVPPP